MNLAEIETNVAELDFSKDRDLIFDLLLAYGLPKSGVTLLRKGTRNLLARSPAEHLWKERVYDRFIDDASLDLHSAIDTAQGDDEISRAKPRFVIVRNRLRLLAIDTRANTTLDIALEDLPTHSAFFMPWAGVEKAQLAQFNYADVKAAEKMARLYDEIAQHTVLDDQNKVRQLNVFFSRLLFCFFAEDTDVFAANSFTNALASLTQEDGSDTANFLDDLFQVLDTEPEKRQATPSHFATFEYVNGRLFTDPVPAPTFTAKARKLVLECGTLDWSEINPDIFGSMIQAVVQPGQRQGLGMHYTSVENILYVIRPLFLDDLEERLERAESPAQLDRLLSDIYRVKVFDPACGSGNFLVIAYKELRRLEHRALVRLVDMDPNRTGLFTLSGIKLDNFYGIEIDDFAHEIAVLSLWLAKHQMNVEFKELFDIEIKLIPLKDTGNILCANAAQVPWSSVCPGDENTYVCGNPPYLGARLLTPSHREDFDAHFGSAKRSNDLDYISIWFLKGAEYIRATDATLGFVSTNSICQGSHAALLWPDLLDQHVEISFARTSFAWSNNAKGTAGVTCVVIGLSSPTTKPKRLFDDAQERRVPHINPYLIASDNDTVVSKTDHPISERPHIDFGNMARDKGHLILNRPERDALIAEYPLAASFVRPFLGAKEFINGLERFCLWIPDSEASAAAQIPPIKTRLQGVETFRAASKNATTKKFAAHPHRFVERRHQEAVALTVPRHSSERRDYVPMGFLPNGTIASDAVLVIYDASPWLFGLLTSRMHMTWLEVVGGRIKTDYRYSNSVVYNTFPFPELTEPDREELAGKATNVLVAREADASLSLADQYDPDKMPTQLRNAHIELDTFVDSLYQSRPFTSDTKRMEVLIARYEAATQRGEEDAESR